MIAGLRQVNIPAVSSLTAAAGWIVALAVAVWLSSSRFVLAPGFEFYLGPLFYLVAYRWFGVRWGLITAVLTMAPSIWWWGHPVSVFLAVGHVLAVAHFRPRQFSFSTITFFYQLTIGTAVAGGLVYWHFNAPIEVTSVVLLRKILCEVTLAGIADIVTLLIVRDGSDCRLRRAQVISLQLSLDALVSVAVSGAATLFLIGTLTNFGNRLSILEDQIRGVVEELRVNAPTERLPATIRVAGSEAPLSLIAVPTAELAAGAQRLGCSRTDRGIGGPDDRNTFTFWMRACVVADTRGGVSILVATRPLVLEIFRTILTGLLPLMAYLLLAEVVLFGFRRSLSRSMRLWDDAVQDFAGRRRIETVDAPFLESTAVLKMLRTATDEYLDADQERERLARTVDELRNAIDLRLMSGLRIGDDALHYLELTPGAGARDVTLPFNPADRGALTSLRGTHDIMAEFRVADSEAQNWFLLLAHDYDAVACEWRFGCLIRLRASEAMQTKMLHNARLIELGGMASALSHELRQPLFTISLAAENGAAMLQRDPPAYDRAKQKYVRILEQVARASAIIERTSTYAREERGDREPTDLVQAIHDAARFMRPVLHERGIELRIVANSAIAPLMLPRIGIEQIIVNALQNAADSIEQARGTGAVATSIRIEIAKRDDHVEIAIRDDGAGLSDSLAESPFDAFSTSKPAGKGTGLGLFICRQIVDEIGGRIALSGNAPGPGATLTLTFPLSSPWSLK
ncbi:HAMP domain-containing histidine kinase [Sphingomonas sp. R647]|uniref:sensor histidine kinase n=1 Tax=Sphingomonas sp. R647 TaxID=2875233 RepID=UPI001CD394AE|nr:HAMP domain-containing sensor histidine kinase [Sphingomonas sp. R647]MCA1197819.1 HAMP domain-containing histidine kinase [Sphingomonas sp. R647]